MTRELIKELKRKVWITRKCRILASDRLGFYDTVSQFFIVYYSLDILCLSIINLVPLKYGIDTSLALVIASVLLFGFTLFVSSRDFKGRAAALKTCYIKLDELYMLINLLDNEYDNISDHKDVYLDLKCKYLNVLDFVENHSLFDYYNAIFQTADEHLCTNERIMLIWYKLCHYIVIIAFFLIPILLLIPLKGLLG